LDKYPENMTVAQVAEVLNCTRKHVSNLIEGRRLPAVNISAKRRKNSHWRVNKSDLQNYIKGGEKKNAE
jgi:excisionase family DNA binding protein